MEMISKLWNYAKTQFQFYTDLGCLENQAIIDKVGFD